MGSLTKLTDWKIKKYGQYETISDNAEENQTQSSRSVYYSGITDLDNEQEKPEMDPIEEKYVDYRLSSIEQTMETAIQHQTERLELIASSLERSVDRSLVESAAVRKESADNNRWWNHILVAGTLSIVIGLLGVIYFVVGSNKGLSGEINSLSKDNMELRKDFSKSQQAVVGVVSKAGKDFYNFQVEVLEKTNKENMALRDMFEQSEKKLQEQIIQLQSAIKTQR